MKPPRRAAGAVVVRPADPGWRYLVLRCFRNWDFPKGIVEAHEAPLDTAMREVAEETSLAGLALRRRAAPPQVSAPTPSCPRAESPPTACSTEGLSQMLPLL